MIPCGPKDLKRYLMTLDLRLSMKFSSRELMVLSRKAMKSETKAPYLDLLFIKEEDDKYL